jgi:hypothetical protein
MFGFKHYLTESKKIYSFRVKIAGECPAKCEALIKDALVKHQCTTVSKGKRTPVQENPHDFPELKNLEVTLFDVECDYPATSQQVLDQLAKMLNLPQSVIRVRTPAEQAEVDLNHAHMQVPGGEKAVKDALLTKDYENNAEGQKLVGDAHVSNFLKELTKISAERKAKITNTEKTEKVESTEPEYDTPKDGTTSPLAKGKTK